MKRTVAFFTACCMAFSLAACSGNQTPPEETARTPWEQYWAQDNADFGVTVQNCNTYLCDSPYNFVGLNCFNLLTVAYASKKADDSLKMLDNMADRGIKLVRFSLTGHGSRDWAEYEANKSIQLEVLERILDRAEEREVLLVPSFFWLSYGLTEYLGEAETAWNDENSKTFAYAMNFTDEMLAMMKDRKCIAGWEFGNEYNLETDLPGTKEFSSADVEFVFSKWAAKVRAADDHNRFITSGNAITRHSQYNLYKNQSWIRDTIAQRKEIVAMYHPAPMDMVCEHVYGLKNSQYVISENGEDVTLDYGSYVRMMRGISTELGQAYFIGEYGFDWYDTSLTETDKRMEYRKMTVEGMEAGTNIMLIWNYALGGADVVECSFDENSPLCDYIFELLAEMQSEYAIPASAE